MRHRFVDDIYAEYLKGQIGGACPIRAKRALQEVCSLYSRGLHLRPLVCAEVEIATVGQFEANRFDRKVRRWCLNVLTLIGTPERARAAVERVIEMHHNDPDTMASALAAFFKVEHNAFSELRGRSYISPEQITLAAHVGNFAAKIRGEGTTIDIEKEGVAILRTSLVAVGLRRAPEHLFHPRFENSQLVRKLSQHDDVEVTQYAVWAINENPELGVEHLGFNIADVGTYMPNIRGWTYRLYGEADIDDGLRHEVIVEGSRDVEVEARLNLARGLRGTWYDGLEAVTCPWLHDEPDTDTREEILDHMVRQSDECGEYRILCLEAFEAAPAANHLPQRLLAAARGKPIYAEMRKLQYHGGGDLFGLSEPARGGQINVTNNNYNIGNIQGGAVSIGGDAEQTGIATNTLTQEQTAQLSVDLRALADQLRQLPSQTDELREITEVVEAAAEEPEPAKLARVRSALGSAFSGTSNLAKFGTDVTKIMTAIEYVMSKLP